MLNIVIKFLIQVFSILLHDLSFINGVSNVFKGDGAVTVCSDIKRLVLGSFNPVDFGNDVVFPFFVLCSLPN